MPTFTVINFLQQGHTYSNKATSPNSATPWAKHIQTTTVNSPNTNQGLKGKVGLLRSLFQKLDPHG